MTGWKEPDLTSQEGVLAWADSAFEFLMEGHGRRQSDTVIAADLARAVRIAKYIDRASRVVCLECGSIDNYECRLCAAMAR